MCPAHSAGRDLLRFHQRTVLTLPDDTPEAALVRSVAIRDALQNCVGKLPVTPAFVVAKAALPAAMWV